MIDNDSVSSFANDTIAFLVEMVASDLGIYTIEPKEVAFGRIEDDKFYCMDNSNSYNIITEVYDGYEPGTLYCAFPKKVNDLKEVYGSIVNENCLMYSYFEDVKKTFNFINKKDRAIHSISSDEFITKTGDPLDALINESSEKETSFTKATKANLVKKTLIENRTKINPLKEEIDLDDFERFMKARIVGNDETIENICTTLVMNLTAENPRDVENILSIGPTGSGKSQSFKNVSEYLDIPVVICDSTQLSSAGYVGKSVEDYLKDVYVRSNKRVDIANRAIFILDEIDKLKSSNLEMKEAAQDSLLKLVEGQAYTVEVDKTYGSSVILDSTGMTIVGCGAFSDIFENRKKGRNIGFDPKINEENPIDDKDGIIYPVTDKELKDFGFKPEFIPRFHNRNVYRELDKDGLRLAYTQSQNSALLAKIDRYLKQFNCEVIYDDSFIDAIVEEAYALKCGGRSLNRINSVTFKKADAELLKSDKTKKKVLKLTGETVKNPSKFDLK